MKNRVVRFFYNGLIGFGVFLVIENLLYYSRLFAGGDAKLMIALGAILPFSTNLSINIKLFITFLFLFFLAGAIYGLTITIYLSLKNFSSFKGEFKRKLKASKKWISFFIFVALMLIALGFLESIFFVLGILVFIFPYFYLYAKTVDSVCMVRRVKTKDITEGEWLYEGVRIGKKLIKPSWEGLSKEELILIRKKYKFIKIKQGIAFVPVFLIAFVIFFYMWEKGLWNAFW